MTDHLVPHPPQTSRADRSRLKGHLPAVLWFTGLSGSGKSTVANAVEYELNHVYGVHTYLLDGDTIRTGLNKDLGFDAAARAENIRRLGEVAQLFFDAGLIVLTAFISPFRADRERARALIPEGAFIEIYMRCPLEVCEQRDPKGLYRKTRAGLLRDFTGVDAPYEAPLNPNLILDSAHTHIGECAQSVIRLLQIRSIIRAAKP